jgi:hypothetical protein
VAASIEVSPELSLLQAHAIAEEARHALLHQESVSVVDIHVDPAELTDQPGYHSLTAHHLTYASGQETDHHELEHKELVHAHEHLTGDFH